MPIISQKGSSGGGSIPSGAGSPIGSVVPTGIGQLYVDTTNGTLYIATGVTSADWFVVGGVTAAHTAVGVYLQTNTLQAVAPSSGSAVLTDKAANAGSGGGAYWNPGRSADGSQTFEVYVDANADTAMALGPAGGGPGVGFYGTSPHAQQTGVAVTAAAIHAALVNLGLITA